MLAQVLSFAPIVLMMYVATSTIVFRKSPTNDTIAPVFINPPQNLFASCENIPSTDDVLATDNCEDTILVSVSQILLSGGCVGVIQRIYTATVACGNTAIHEQYITLVDTIAPVLANLPADTTYECHDVIPDPADVTATDNCDDTVAVVFNSTTPLLIAKVLTNTLFFAPGLLRISARIPFHTPRKSG